TRALQLLRQLLDDPSASFRSTDQANAVFRVMTQLRTKENLLVVMPTGSGKSLLYTLPAMHEDDKLTVLLVPFVALMMDTSRRLDRMRVPHVLWNNHLDVIDSQVRLILVPAENASSDAFLALLSQLSELDKLARVVIDEAHTIV
ncbi:hypothetical protein BC940DRAFT_215071, partial [Gongronella butleri]